MRGLVGSSYTELDRRICPPGDAYGPKQLSASYPARLPVRLRGMRRTAVLSLLLSLCLFAPGLAAAQSVLEQALAAEVARTAAASGALGVNIVELDTGETVFSHRADEPRVIASNSKLFTTAAALDALGPRLLLRDPSPDAGSGGQRNPPGDLGVVGAGDPQISGREYGGDSYGAFRPWAAALRARGVQRITGDLYLATASSSRHRSTPSGRATSSPTGTRPRSPPSPSATTASWCGSGRERRGGWRWWRPCRRCRSSAWTTPP